MASQTLENHQTMLQCSQKKFKRSNGNNTNGGSTDFLSLDHSGDVLDKINTTDFLSLDLSDDVLENIFSFFPIKQAARLGILSKRFRNSWRLNRNLCFDKDFARRRLRSDVIRIINQVLDLHSGTNIKTFLLFIDPNGVEAMVDYWIRSVISKGVEELDLDFSLGKKDFKLLVDVKSLTVLNLTSCKLDLSPNLKGNLCLLTTLVLRKVEVVSVSMETLLSNCLLLERLELVKCYKIGDLKILGQKFSVLRLEGCFDVSSITIDAPSLCSLHYHGYVTKINFNGTMWRLVDVVLNFGPAKGFRQPSRHVMMNLMYVNFLTVNGTFLEGLSPQYEYGKLRQPQFCLCYLKEFQLSVGDSYINPCDIALFLNNCPFVERIFIDLGESSFECKDYWKLNAKEIFEQCNPSFQCLKLIKVKGFKFQQFELEMVKFFLEKARFLDTLALVSSQYNQPKFFSHDAYLYYTHILYWRTSPNAKVEMYEYLKDRSFIYPRHRHVKDLYSLRREDNLQL